MFLASLFGGSDLPTKTGGSLADSAAGFCSVAPRGWLGNVFPAGVCNFIFVDVLSGYSLGFSDGVYNSGTLSGPGRAEDRCARPHWKGCIFLWYFPWLEFEDLATRAECCVLVCVQEWGWLLRREVLLRDGCLRRHPSC